jgi:hypothetical protein
MPQLSELESTAAFWDWVSYVALIVAFVGALLEFVANQTRAITSPWWRSTIKRTAAWIVLFTLGVGLIASWRLSTINSRIVALLNKAAAEAGERASKADERAGDAFKKAKEAETKALQFEASIASSRARAEEARQIAERERLERVKIEERLAWRSLGGADQQQRIVTKLKKFPGTPFVLRVFQEPEALRLLNQVVDILHSATWVQKPIVAATEISTKHGAAGISLGLGIIISVDPSRASELGPAGKALVAALADERIASEFRVVALQLQPEIIHIAIGKKP